MKRVAIIGAGPTGVYTLFHILRTEVPLAISIYEQGEQAGVGMPYGDDVNSRLMLANIASIEIPPIGCTYLDWLREQDEGHLRKLGVDKAELHERQFLPRILLGEYFRDRFLELVDLAKAQGCRVAVHESCRITDVEALADGVKLWAEGEAVEELFDLAVIATGHVWPDEEEATRSFFPSPWSGLLDADIPACKVGIMGTSLSAIDAAMAVAAQHGRFVGCEDEVLGFELSADSEGLSITLMSRTGVLPEADFYCPIPYEPLKIATPEAIEAEIKAGEKGLLDRIFTLVAREISEADPAWSEQIGLSGLDADCFADAYFASRLAHDPFHWAEYNLKDVERNKRERRTVAWRYAILRLHEPVQDIVPHLSEDDRERFDGGLGRVFVDNYAAVPSESIRRLLALRKAGIISVLELGPDYEMEVGQEQTEIVVEGERHAFDVFIDARGQKPLKTKDLPFARLRRQLLAVGDDIPDVSDDYTLTAPVEAEGRIAFGALPYLMHDQPFVQGITASADIGMAIAAAVAHKSSHLRRKLGYLDSFAGRRPRHSTPRLAENV